MAVKPQQLLEQLTLAAQEQMARLEAEVDKHVEDHFEGGSLYVPISEYPKAHVAAKLIEKYKAAGWATAEFGSDQRDGSYFELGYEEG